MADTQNTVSHTLRAELEALSDDEAGQKDYELRTRISRLPPEVQVRQFRIDWNRNQTRADVLLVCGELLEDGHRNAVLAALGPSAVVQGDLRREIEKRSS